MFISDYLSRCWFVVPPPSVYVVRCVLASAAPRERRLQLCFHFSWPSVHRAGVAGPEVGGGESGYAPHSAKHTLSLSGPPVQESSRDGISPFHVSDGSFAC